MIGLLLLILSVLFLVNLGTAVSRTWDYVVWASSGRPETEGSEKYTFGMVVQKWVFTGLSLLVILILTVGIR